MREIVYTGPQTSPAWVGRAQQPGWEDAGDRNSHASLSGAPIQAAGILTKPRLILISTSK